MACVRLWTLQVVTCRLCGQNRMVRFQDVDVAERWLRQICNTGKPRHEPQCEYTMEHRWAWRGRVSDWPEY